MSVSCPHCHAPLRSRATSCETCGQTARTDRWEVSANLALATTRIGRKMQAEQAVYEAKLACSLLLGLALVESAVFAVFSALTQASRAASISPSLFWFTGASAVVCLLVAIWSRRDVFTAAIALFAAHAAAWGLCTILDPTELFRGLPLKLLVLAVGARVLVSGVRLRHFDKLLSAQPEQAQSAGRRLRIAG